MISNSYLALTHSTAHTHKTGRQPGKTTPFKDLRVDKIKKELHIRGITDLDLLKPDLQKKLTHDLKGVQRVPSLLLLNPQKTPSDLNLHHYTILDCEPLHDLKGHLDNMFEELPNILPDIHKKKCTDLIEAKLGPKVSGADMLATVITMYQLLKNENTPQQVSTFFKRLSEFPKSSIWMTRNVPQNMFSLCTTAHGSTWSYVRCSSLIRRR